jgi:hypothetical protein
MYAQEVLANVRVQHTDGAERAGMTWHVNPPAPERAGNAGTVHRPGATGSDERKMLWIVSALDADALDGMQQVLLQQPDDANRRCFPVNAKGARHFRIDGCFGGRGIEGHAATSVRTGPQAAENHMRVGHGRLGAADAVARGTRIGASAARPDV